MPNSMTAWFPEFSFDMKSCICWFERFNKRYLNKEIRLGVERVVSSDPVGSTILKSVKSDTVHAILVFKVNQGTISICETTQSKTVLKFSTETKVRHVSLSFLSMDRLQSNWEYLEKLNANRRQFGHDFLSPLDYFVTDSIQLSRLASISWPDTELWEYKNIGQSLAKSNWTFFWSNILFGTIQL